MERTNTLAYNTLALITAVKKYLDHKLTVSIKGFLLMLWTNKHEYPWLANDEDKKSYNINPKLDQSHVK
jgi:hypothetical protein